MKFYLILLTIAFLACSTQANIFTTPTETDDGRWDIKVQNLNLQRSQSNEFKGRLETDYLFITQGPFELTLNSGRVLPVDMTMQPNLAIMKTPDFTAKARLPLDTEKFPIEALRLNQSTLHKDPSSIKVGGGLCEIKTADTFVNLNQFALICERKINESIFASCLNRSSLTPTPNQALSLLQFRSPMLNGSAQIQNLTLSENKMSLKAGAVIAQKDKIQAKLPSLKMLCGKKRIGDQNELKDLVTHCIEKSQTEIPWVEIIQNNIHLLAENINARLDNEATSLLSAKNINLARNTVLAHLDQFILSCPSSMNENGLAAEKLIRSCLKQGDLTLSDLIYQDSESKTQAQINIQSVGFRNNQFSFTAPSAELTKESLKVSLSDLGVTCLLAQEDDILDADLLLKRCFDSSQLAISKIHFENPTTNLYLDVQEIALNKELIKMMVPQGFYELNGNKNVLYGLNFDCSLHASLENFKDLDGKSLITNCVQDSNIKVDYLETTDNNKKRSLKNVRFVTKQNYFWLDLTTRAGIFPVKAHFDGKIEHHRERNVIIMEVYNAHSRFLTENMLMLFLNVFFKSDTIHVNGKTITIDLPEMKAALNAW